MENGSIDLALRLQFFLVLSQFCVFPAWRVLFLTFPYLEAAIDLWWTSHPPLEQILDLWRCFEIEGQDLHEIDNLLSNLITIVLLFK